MVVNVKFLSHLSHKHRGQTARGVTIKKKRGLLMKKNATISCGLFSLLFVMQLFLLLYVGGNLALTGLPVWVLAEVAALFVFAGMATRLFAKGELEETAKKTVAAAGVFYVLTLVVFYGVQLSLIFTALGTFNQALGQNVVAGWVVYGVKVVLFAAAVWFAVCPEKEVEVTLEFETARDAAELESPQAVEEIKEQLDEKEV